MLSLLRRTVPDLGLAAAAGLLVIMLAAIRDHAILGVPLGLLVAITIAMSGPLARAGSRPQLSTVRLPGHPDPARPVTRTATRTAAAAMLLLAGLASVSGSDWAMIGAGLAGVIITAILATMIRRRTATVGDRAAVTSAIADYAPRMIIYTSRENGSGYQLAMWLPLIEQLGERYLIVVRHRAAQFEAVRLTRAPVICAPLAMDLDAVIVDSIKVACYVNVVGGNANLIGYRSLRHVYLGHGDSDKEASVHPTHAMFDKIFIAGPAARERYRKAGLDLPDDRFVTIGRPQLADVETPGSERVEEPAVLLAPTWRGYNSRTDLSSLPYCRMLVEALIRREASVIFRPHPLSWESPAERALIDQVDALLRRDRSASTRRHQLASEGRGRTLTEAFNASDALITDVGGLLVDYFATGKPYAVVLSESNPQPRDTTSAAYLITHDQLRSGDLDDALDDLLKSDPSADRRAAVAKDYLGSLPCSTGPFKTALGALLAE